MNMEQLVEWELAGGTEVLGEKPAPLPLSSTTNPTCPGLGSNPGHFCGKLATNQVSQEYRKIKITCSE
jgi:hypothetical protein